MKRLVLLIINASAFYFCSFAMQTKAELQKFKSEVEINLIQNILPFWSDKMIDKNNGGFYGSADESSKVIKNAERGGILNARILWTFSAAFRVLKDSSYLKTAKHSKDYVLKYFIDNEFGGTFRSVNKNGKPADTRKQAYSQAFFIYALTEFYLASGDTTALNEAVKIFNCVEKYCFDKENNGYFDSFNREWKRINDKMISERTDADKKSMNTHLHLLEAYTNLYRAKPDTAIEKRLKNLIILFTQKLIDRKTYHLIVFTDEKWQATSSLISFGHDIETSWLLVEAAEALGDKNLIQEMKRISIKMAFAASDGLKSEGAMISEREISGKESKVYDWWTQAETITGYFNAYQLSGNIEFLAIAQKCWQFTNKSLVDHTNGEWFFYVSENGKAGGDKAGFWKCPYHNGRMCLEIIKRNK